MTALPASPPAAPTADLYRRTLEHLGFAERPEQARLVAELRRGGRVVVQAGAGTGESLAALVHAAAACTTSREKPMTRSGPPILAAVTDAVHSATPDQLPLPEVSLWSRALRRLPAGVSVSLADVRDAARHLCVVGLLRRDGGNWAPGPLAPEDGPIQPRHEAMFWAARRRTIARGIR